MTPDTVTSVELPDIASVTLPAGCATGGTLAVSIVPEAQQKTLLEPARPQGLTLAGNVVEITLRDGTLTGAMTVVLAYDRTLVPAGMMPFAYTYNERTGRWVYLGGQPDAVKAAVSYTAPETGRFAVFSRPPLPPMPDVRGRWVEQAATCLAGMGVVQGHEDGTFAPDATASRAEVAAMLARALLLEGNEEAARQFSDAGEIGWVSGAAGALAEAGIVRTDSGAFHPDRLATRAEVTVMLVRAVQEGLATPLEKPRITFSDQGDFPAWAASAISDATTYGLVCGRPGGVFDANRSATRAEIATMIYRLIAE